MKLSVLIPAQNEEKSIAETLTSLYQTLCKERIIHEIIVIDDHSADKTTAVLSQTTADIPTLKHYQSNSARGFGNTIRFGLGKIQGDCVAIVMADNSDSPQDLVKFFRKMEQTNCDAVFGSRFIKGGKVAGYPFHKLILNRLVNNFIKILFNIKYNNTTNAFKLYKKEAIDGLKPILSPHFNLTVELPLKIIIRGYNYYFLPNSWTNRKQGQSKLKIEEMGSRYLFIILYCFIEKLFSRGDYKKNRLKFRLAVKSLSKIDLRLAIFACISLSVCSLVIAYEWIRPDNFPAAVFGYFDQQLLWDSLTKFSQGKVIYRDFYFEYGTLYLILGWPIFLFFWQNISFNSAHKSTLFSYTRR